MWSEREKEDLGEQRKWWKVSFLEGEKEGNRLKSKQSEKSEGLLGPWPAFQAVSVTPVGLSEEVAGVETQTCWGHGRAFYLFLELCHP